MQQGDQPRPALIGDAAFGLDPGTHLAGCPRQCLGNPGFQFVLLRVAPAAAGAFVAKARQAFDALCLIYPDSLDTRVSACQPDSAECSQAARAATSSSTR